MEDGNPCRLTTAEEAHHLDIHQRHLVEVQHCPGAVALQLGFQGLKMLGFKLTPCGRTRALDRRTPSCSHYILDIPRWA
jgi:hypothetical protein